jgi:hypothetical protein
VKNLAQKDLRTLKFEMTSKDFDTKTAPLSFSVQLGIAKDGQEPINSQKKEMGVIETKQSYLLIKLKCEADSEDEAQKR